jgi:hypothetical protein
MGDAKKFNDELLVNTFLTIVNVQFTHQHTKVLFLLFLNVLFRKSPHAFIRLA